MHRLSLIPLLAACATPPDPPVQVTSADLTMPAAPPAAPPESTLAVAQPATRAAALRAPVDVPFATAGLANGDIVSEILLTDERSGQPFTLSHHLGVGAARPSDAALVSFSASWCGPCQASLPQLATLKEEHGDALLVLIVSIDADAAGLRREVAAVERAGLDAVVVHAPEDLQRAWLGDTRNIPHFFITNAIGEVMVQDRGYGENAQGMLPRQLAYAMSHPEYVER